jgi:hypothetical protein
MISKKLRNKVVAGVLGVSLVGGTVFASTNAGDKLQAWYNTELGKSTSVAWTSAYNYAAGEAGKVYSWLVGTNGVEKTAIANISSAATSEISRANGEINKVANAYIADLNDKEETIEAGMEGQYDSFVTGKNTYVDGEATKYTTISKADVQSKLDAQGTTSLNKVTTDVTATQTSAVSALESAIATAKSELTGLMATEKTTAEEEMKAHINAQVTAKKAEIQKLSDELEVAKKAAITTEGSRIEGEAKAALDNLVNGI